MCGICGVLNFDGRPVNGLEIAAMRDVMPHRGPDGHGIFVDGAIGLGHRRLSIIDLEGGHQPLANEDGTVTIVFNGEIYNFGDLRPELEARGHKLATRSDTEVIVHLYEDKGAQCVESLRGMFAFAIWDGRKRELLLARDRLGVKPLYYAQTSAGLAFASEIKSLFQSGLIQPEVDPSGLRRCLAYRHSYGDGTMFKGVRQLPPGHVLTANARGVTVRRYWDVPDLEEAGTRDASIEEFTAVLDESVRLRMISDVPIGCFLSGGVDSSTVTALMSRHTDRVRTFSVGFVPGEENELAWAKTVASQFNTDHHEFMLGSENFFSLLEKLVWHHDEPMIFPASIPLYLLSKESKAKATVMLAGEGADEILAGYDTNVRTYWLGRTAGRIPPVLRRLAAKLPLPQRAAAAAGRMALDDRELIAGNFRLADHDGITRACRTELPSASADDEALMGEIGFEQRGGTFLDRLLYFQLKTYLVALLMKQDKMSMAASIETRVPFLDHHLVSLAFSLPDHQKVNGRVGKFMLKEVARRLLPSSVVDRPKQGFPVPIDRWFRQRRNPFIDVLLDSESLDNGLLDPAFVRRRVEHFLAGAPTSVEIWALLNLELWRLEYLGGTARMRSVAS